MDSQVGYFRLYIMKRNIRKILDTDCASEFYHGYLRIIIYAHALESKYALC